MRFCNAFSSFDVTLVVSFVKECFFISKANFILIESCFVPFALFRWRLSKYASGPIMARWQGCEV